VRMEVKQTSHLTPPNNPNMSSVVVLVFSLDGWLPVSCQNPDNDIEVVFTTLVFVGPPDVAVSLRGFIENL